MGGSCEHGVSRGDGRNSHEVEAFRIEDPLSRHGLRRLGVAAAVAVGVVAWLGARTARAFAGRAARDRSHEGLFEPDESGRSLRLYLHGAQLLDEAQDTLTISQLSDMVHR